MIPLPALGPLLIDIPHWSYTSAAGRGWGICRLRVWESPDCRYVAVVTELPDNPGPSVTNSQERIIPALRSHFGGLLVVEHYLPSPDAAPAYFRSHRLSVVFLADDSPRPEWYPLWPVSPQHPEFDAHQMWAQVYFEDVTGVPPVTADQEH